MNVKPTHVSVLLSTSRMITNIILLASVIGDMGLKVSPCYESFSTLRIMTDKLLIPGVDPNMDV